MDEENTQNEDQQPNEEKVISWIVVGIIIFAALILGLISLLFFQFRTLFFPITPVVTPIPNFTTPFPNRDTTSPINWGTYTSSSQNFSIKYPPDMKIQENQDDSVSFIRLGPTQTQDTELFDGISLTINSGIFTSNTFANFVDERRKEAQSEPAIQSAGRIQPTTVAGKPGYRFTIVGLGEFTHIYLRKEDNQYIRIIMSVEDPTNRGFQRTVDTMLSTLKF